MVKAKFKKLAALITGAQDIVIIQAENPDGDSIASALALEQILSDLGKTPHLYCYIEMPRYLRYLPGWDRVEQALPSKFDLSIVVDASAETLLSRSLQAYRVPLSKKPCLVIDHHDSPMDLAIATTSYIDSKAVSVGEILFEIATDLKWPLNQQTAYFIATSIISDSGNFVYEKTTAKSLQTVATLVEQGLNLRHVHIDRRKSDVVPPSILTYKGELLQRISYHHEQSIALLTIPWEEIEKYSDLYNPSELVIGEMLMVEKVQLAVVFKVYPDQTITAKIRANLPVAAELGSAFGGGGHAYAAGCKVSKRHLDEFSAEFIAKAGDLINSTNQSHHEVV